jgi:preprotein translocase subunit YajC
MRLLATAAILVSGLHGTVTKGPTAPVCRVGQPCSAPAQVTLVFRRLGHVYRTHSTAQGTYRITLRPGYYTVTTAEQIGIIRNIRPQRVHVRLGHQDKLDFRIDTGIR